MLNNLNRKEKNNNSNNNNYNNDDDDNDNDDNGGGGDWWWWFPNSTINKIRKLFQNPYYIFNNFDNYWKKGNWNVLAENIDP